MRGREIEHYMENLKSDFGLCPIFLEARPLYIFNTKTQLHLRGMIR